jgi:endonuclease/exonuclease/phosphatase family metal-dependent hydrolase
MNVRLATLDVGNTEGDAGRLHAINRELARLNPDLVAFQEVVQNTTIRSLDVLVEGLNLPQTHQADLQRIVPPFAHPKAHARVHSAALAFDQPIGGLWASDHFGIVLDLDIGMGGWRRMKGFKSIRFKSCL